MKLSQGATSGLKPKAEVTPKVTLTKTSIVKSSPFLISRHHLDDTQMYGRLYVGSRPFGMRRVSLPAGSPGPTAIKARE